MSGSAKNKLIEVVSKFLQRNTSNKGQSIHPRQKEGQSLAHTFTVNPKKVTSIKVYDSDYAVLSLIAKMENFNGQLYGIVASSSAPEQALSQDSFAYLVTSNSEVVFIIPGWLARFRYIEDVED